MTTPREKLGLLLAFVGVVLFGGTLPATRIAVAGLDPWFVTTARAALAGAAALTLLVILRRPLPTFAQWKQFAAATFFVTVCFPLFMALAMQTVPAAHGGVVVGIMPIATPSRLSLKRQRRIRDLLGCVRIFNEHRDTLATADARGRYTVALSGAPQFARHGNGNAHTGSR